MANGSGWDKPITDLPKIVEEDKIEIVSRLTLYALGQFKNLTPVLTGQLRRSFTAGFSRNKKEGVAGSNLPYAERIWVHGWSSRLSPMAIDLVIANMQQLPINLD